MLRNRDESRWASPFNRYSSVREFLKSDLRLGGNTILHREKEIDIFVESRNSKITLVVFSAAMSRLHRTYPHFSGQGLAVAAGVNLISISEPLVQSNKLSVAWYLGDKQTGPLKPLLVSAVNHILQRLHSEETILFGASGGGFAAAHLAHSFPDSTAVVVNPRLSLERDAELPVKKYLQIAHGIESNGVLTDRHKRYLTNYGPTNIEDIAVNGLNHELLIYQNVLDASFLRHQLLPFITTVGADPRLHIKFNSDRPGHVPIPSAEVKNILRVLTSNTNKKQSIKQAGFLPNHEASFHALSLLPDISLEMSQTIKREKHLRKEIQEQGNIPNTALNDFKDKYQKLVEENNQYRAIIDRKNSSLHSLSLNSRLLIDKISDSKTSP